MKDYIERYVWSCKLGKELLLKGNHNVVKALEVTQTLENNLFMSNLREERNILLMQKPWWKKLLGL